MFINKISYIVNQPIARHTSIMSTRQFKSTILLLNNSKNTLAVQQPILQNILHTNQNKKLKCRIIDRIVENEKKLSDNIDMNPDHSLSVITCSIASMGTSIGFYNSCNDVIHGTSDSRFIFPILFGVCTACLGVHICKDIRYILYKKTIRDKNLNNLKKRINKDIKSLTILSQRKNPNKKIV
jgi:hypothetical protein